jgi:hypothetical protein
MEAAATMRETPTTRVAVDLGTRWTKVAAGGGGHGRVRSWGGPQGVPGPGPAALRALAGGSAEAGAPVGRVLGEILATGPDSVARSLGPVGPLVVAVPDAWYVDAAGVLARERLRELLRREHGVVLHRCVAQAEGAAAGLAVSGRASGPVLVCDLGAGGATVAYCEIDDGGVEVVDLETAGDGATASAFVDAVADVVRGPLDQVEAMLLAGATRAGMVLGRVGTQPRYRGTPVLRGTGTAPVTAGQVVACFEPVAERLTAMVEALVGRRAAAREARTVALAGGLARFPLTAPTVLAALAPDPAPTVVVLEPGAVAHGAAAVAGGEVRLRGPAAPALSLPVHQVRGGRLVAGSVPLTRDGRPAGVGAAGDDGPLVVEVGDLQPPSGAPPAVHLERDGAPRAAVLQPARPVPPGRYTAGLWPFFGALGALALRPLSGGDPLVYTIHDPAGAQEVRR